MISDSNSSSQNLTSSVFGGIEFSLDADGKGQYRAAGASTWTPFLSGGSGSLVNSIDFVSTVTVNDADTTSLNVPAGFKGGYLIVLAYTDAGAKNEGVVSNTTGINVSKIKSYIANDSDSSGYHAYASFYKVTANGNSGTIRVTGVNATGADRTRFDLVETSYNLTWKTNAYGNDGNICEISVPTGFKKGYLIDLTYTAGMYSNEGISKTTGGAMSFSYVTSYFVGTADDYSKKAHLSIFAVENDGNSGTIYYVPANIKDITERTRLDLIGVG